MRTNCPVEEQPDDHHVLNRRHHDRAEPALSSPASCRVPSVPPSTPPPAGPSAGARTPVAKTLAMRRLLLLIVGVTGASACASEMQYAYHPAEQATATLAGHAAARYGVPPEAPRGSVRVASCGITSVETGSGEVRALHVRLAISNNNDTGPWELDARALRVAYAAGDVVGPTFINTRAPGMPRVEIAPREATVVDAYFPLPPGAESAESVPRFDLLWELRTPAREVAERTPFERIRIEPEVAVDAGYGLGRWPAWWYDPFLPGPPVIIQQRPRVYVITPPRR
jgi:hypothetical protein